MRHSEGRGHRFESCRVRQAAESLGIFLRRRGGRRLAYQSLRDAGSASTSRPMGCRDRRISGHHT